MEIALGVLLLAAAALGVAWAISLYNGLERVRGELRKAWSALDVLLQQRHDELAPLEAKLRADYDLAPTSAAKTDVENRLNLALAGTELRIRKELETAIAERRTSFNHAVSVYNAYRRAFPFARPHPRLEAQRATEAQDAPPPKL